MKLSIRNFYSKLKKKNDLDEQNTVTKFTKIKSMMVMVLVYVLQFGIVAIGYGQASTPGIELDPNSGPPGTEIVVVGSGFIESECGVNLFLDSFEGIFLGFAATDDGEFVSEVSIPSETVPGEYRILAEGLLFDNEFCGGPSGEVADESFTVTSLATITEVFPSEGNPGTFIRVRASGLGSFDEGFYGVLFNGAPGTIIEPIIDSSGRYNDPVLGFHVLIPPDATTGPITLILPDFRITSETDFTVIPLNDDEPDPVPLLSLSTEESNGYTGLLNFRRLEAPNFTSEVADSKDVVISDLDNDTDLDIFIPQTLDAEDAVYRNEGNDADGAPIFTVLVGQVTNDVAEKRQYGAAAADLDGNGALDVVPSGAGDQPIPNRIRLLMGDGNLNFTDEAMSRITDLDMVTGEGFAWDDVKIADVNDDNILDIAMANRAAPCCDDENDTSTLLLGTGSGNFEAIPDAFGEPADDVHHDVLLCDLNNDNLPEVILSQDMRGNMRPLRVLFNEGGATPTFDDISSQLTPNPNHRSEHVGCVDFNNDGRMDIHVGVWERADKDPASPDPGYRQDMIFLNNSSDTDNSGAVEADEIVMTLVAQPEPSGEWGQGFDAETYSGTYGDFDNDGFIDILVGSMTPDPDRKGPFLMRNNNGNGTFTNISPTNAFWRNSDNSGFDHFNPTSPAVADLNGDGLLDIVWGLGDLMNGVWREANRIYIQENDPPLADICEDQIVVECMGLTTTVMLDGTCSSDPEGGVLSYQWSSATCVFDNPTLEKPNVSCPLGVNTVSLVVTDSVGLSSEPATATIEVVDTTPPDIMCPEDKTVECDQPTDPSNTGNAEATDACDPDPTISFEDTIIPGSCPQEFDIIRTWRAVDSEGNSNSCDQEISVVDTTPPEINSLAADKTVLWPPNHRMKPVSLTVSSSDNCDDAPVCKIDSVVSNEPVNGLGDGNTSPDWEVTGDLNVNLRSERSGKGNGRIYTVTVICTDACGNDSEGSSVEVSVPHSKGKKK